MGGATRSSQGVAQMASGMKRTWHDQHAQERTLGEKLADGTARTLGSWPFIIGQTVVVALWVALNVTAVVRHWDPYPFILLNLMFSVQAAYAAPVIMMSQNRQADRDRYQARSDYETNVKAECEVEDLQARLGEVLDILRRIDGATTEERQASH